MGRTVAKGGGSLFLALFGIPFFAVGVGMGVVTFRTLVAAHQMKSWQEVPATITSAELQVSHGDESTSYRAASSYTYFINGNTYSGDRVSLSSGYDNIGSFHQRVYAELKGFHESRKPFRCYVDPSNPAESILYREPRWEKVGFFMIFVLVFGGVGLGLILFGSISWWKSRHEKSQKALEPEKPWMWKPEWAAGIMTSSNKIGMWVSIGFALFWNLIAMPVGAMVVVDVLARKAEPVALIALLFPVVGVGLIIWAIRNIIQWSKFGESKFEMVSCPGVIGGPLGGVIRVPVHIRPEAGFQLTLSCVNRVTTGSGKQRSTHENVLWQDERVMKRELLERDLSKSAIPVLFGIPHSARPTDETDSSNQILWRLEVKADVPGVDYHANFDVPVFRTEASSPDFRLDESAIAPYVEAVDPAALLRSSGIRIEPLAGGGKRLHFTAARHVGSAMGLTLFFAVWTGAVVLGVKLHAPLVFPIIFGLVDVAIFFGVLRMWFGAWTVEVGKGGMTVTSRMLGWSRTTAFDRAAVSALDAVPGMQSGNRQFFDIKFSAGGKTVTAAGRLSSAREAHATISVIKEVWGETETAAGVSGGQKLPPMAKSMPVE